MHLADKVPYEPPLEVRGADDASKKIRVVRDRTTGMLYAYHADAIDMGTKGRIFAATRQDGHALCFKELALQPPKSQHSERYLRQNDVQSPRRLLHESTRKQAEAEIELMQIAQAVIQPEVVLETQRDGAPSKILIGMRPAESDLLGCSRALAAPGFAFPDRIETLDRQRFAVREAFCAKVLYQLASQTHQMHQAGVLHRDIKLENILCLMDHAAGLYQACLADFGSAKRLQTSTAGPIEAGTTSSVTYMPPELATANAYARDCKAGDIWRLGIVMLTLLCCDNPFAGDGGEADVIARLHAYRNLRRAGRNNHLAFLPEVLFHSRLHAIIAGMLAPFPYARWTAEQVVVAVERTGLLMSPAMVEADGFFAQQTSMKRAFDERAAALCRALPYIAGDTASTAPAPACVAAAASE